MDENTRAREAGRRMEIAAGMAPTDDERAQDPSGVKTALLALRDAVDNAIGEVTPDIAGIVRELAEVVDASTRRDSGSAMADQRSEGFPHFVTSDPPL